MEKTFEQSIKELEQVVLELEKGDLSLDDAIAKFEAGIKLSKECESKLDMAEKKINVLVGKDELKEEVAELKGKDVCPGCKNHVDADAAFCPKCGAKVEDDVEVVDVEVEDANDFAEVVENVAEEVVFEEE